VHVDRPKKLEIEVKTMRIRSGEEIEDGLCPDSSAPIWSEPQLLQKSQLRINTTDLPMADKKVFLPQVEEFAGEDSAPKTKAPTTGLDGCAAKRKVQYGYACSKGEETAYKHATTDKAAGLSEVTMAADEMMEQQDDSNLHKFYEEWKAEYAQLMDAALLLTGSRRRYPNDTSKKSDGLDPSCFRPSQIGLFL
jgi:hypothetical protein